MNSIEVIIVLLLLFMAVPDFCPRLKRPALAYSVFVLLGLAIGPVVNTRVCTMLGQAGQVGFLLLLFEVGLEIDLPPLCEFLRSVRFASAWLIFQYPVVVVACLVAGWSGAQACLAAAALTGCAVGMAYPAWKHYPGLTEPERTRVLQIMVALEMLTIVVLSVNATVLQNGLSPWIAAKLLGIATVIFLLARFALHLVPLFQRIIAQATHWRTHWLVLLILAVCAVGQRVGLDAVKTAYFLGLALSRAKHHGMKLEDHIAPISHRFLIPIFFVSLGLQVQWRTLVSLNALLAVGVAGVLLGLREVIHRRCLRSSATDSTYLLFCPNLTLVALAANALLQQSNATEPVAWLLLAGLFITVPSILFLPAASGDETSPGTHTPPANPPDGSPAAVLAENVRVH